METVAHSLDFTPEELLKENERLRCALESKEHQIKLLEEKVNYLLHQRFGAKSERFDGHQQHLFTDKEAGDEAVPPEVDIEVPSPTRKPGGRRMPPKCLPRVRVEHDLPADQRRCRCGQELSRIGEEISFQYDVIPAQFQVLENVRFKYACTNAHCGEAPKTAPQDPPPPLPRTQAAPGVLAWIATSKFVDGLALNRIAAIAEKRFGAPFTSTTLADWMIKGAQLIATPLVEAIEAALSGCDYLHIDETTLQVLNEAGREAKQKSYLWCRVSGSGLPIVLMHYSPSRSGVVAGELLKGFSGYLHSDGYSGYDAPASREEITQLGCWAHVRRKFDAATKGGSPGATHLAREGLKQIRDLYYLDNQGKQKPPDERTHHRQAVVKPQLARIRTWIDAHQGRALGYGGLLATAFTYIHNQWRKLIVFIEDPNLSLDNNKAERHIRPIATGRKVWLFANSEAGAAATACWYSLVETAKANDLEPYGYLRLLFERVPLYLRDNKPLDDLLPWNLDQKALPSWNVRG